MDNKRPATLETVNDIDGDVVNLFKVIRERADELARMVYWTPYSREEYKVSYGQPRDDIDRARRFLVKCWHSIRVKTGSISGWKFRGTADHGQQTTFSLPGVQLG